MKTSDFRLMIQAAFAALLFASCSPSPPTTRQVNSATPSRPSGLESHSSPLATFSGRVVRIEDGDTISVLDEANRNYKIRLQGIDAPEGGQAFGDRSRQSLADEVFGKQVSVEWSKRDQYGRIVGKVLLDGRDVCLSQIRAGMAWHYKYYQNEQSAEDRKMYADAEEEARMARRGLWVDVDPTPPWEFRRSGNK
jgi:endonuclease YncB( thermonuclease family)